MKLLIIFIFTGMSFMLTAGSAEKLIVNQSMVADYIFNSNLSSSKDGAPDLEYLGSNLNYQEDTVFGITKKVVDFADGEGFKLDISNLIISQEYSTSMVFKVSMTSGYVKLIDFKNLNDDNGLYLYSGKLSFFPDAIGSEVAIQENQFVQLMFTHTSAGVYKGYINHELQFEYSDVNGDSTPSNDALLHFFRDDNATGNSENSPGSVSRITIFNKALTLAEILEFEPLDTIFRNGFE